jgi:hypothetical protein
MLRPGPQHGYDIKKDIDRAPGGMVSLNNKTLYLALKCFEEIAPSPGRSYPKKANPIVIPIS